MSAIRIPLVPLTSSIFRIKDCISRIQVKLLGFYFLPVKDVLRTADLRAICLVVPKISRVASSHPSGRGLATLYPHSSASNGEFATVGRPAIIWIQRYLCLRIFAGVKWRRRAQRCHFHAHYRRLHPSRGLYRVLRSNRPDQPFNPPSCYVARIEQKAANILECRRVVAMDKHKETRSLRTSGSEET